MTLAFAFSSPLHTYIEEMRCNILCGCKKKASQQLRHGFLYPRPLLLLLDPRANEAAAAAVQLVRQRAHLSRFIHRQRQQKRRGPKKELASAAAVLVAT
jgi:hypothetical protein